MAWPAARNTRPQREAAREDQDGNERDEAQVPLGIGGLHGERDEKTHDDHERPEDGRVRPAEEARAARRPASSDVDQPRKRRTIRTSSAPMAIASQPHERSRLQAHRAGGTGASPRRSRGPRRGTAAGAPALFQRETRRHRAEEEARVETEGVRPAPRRRRSTGAFCPRKRDLSKSVSRTPAPTSSNSPLFAP